jgi:hypothetical protein
MTRLPPNPALQELEPLIGEWRVEIPQFPGAHGRATFDWLEDGAFLRCHTDAPDPAPSATLIISRDEAGENYTYLHYDSRGVSRVYQMSFGDRSWRVWRDVPGFAQRFSGSLSEDGATITAAWEKSADGSAWEDDFDLIYTRVRP